MKIYNKQWDELQNIPCIEHSRAVKNNLVDEIANTLQEGYYNRREGVKRAIDKMCFLAKEKGFAFASPTYYMDKFGIGKDAIYSIVKAMVEANLVVKCNRSSSKQNGLGCWVIIFRSHPNFEAISSILNLKEKAEPKANQKAEITENLCVPTDSADNSEATFSLPTNTHSLKENVKQLNVEPIIENKVIKNFVKYVPKAVNEMYANLFGDDLVHIWRKITLAIKKIGFEFDRETRVEYGMKVLKALFVRVKRGSMTLDEMCAYVYTTTRNMVYNELGEGFVADMVEDEYGTWYYNSIESESGLCPTEYIFVAKKSFTGYNWLTA